MTTATPENRTELKLRLSRTRALALVEDFPCNCFSFEDMAQLLCRLVLVRGFV